MGQFKSNIQLVLLNLNLRGRLGSVDDVRGDSEGKVDDVIVELVREPVLSLNVKS